MSQLAGTTFGIGTPTNYPVWGSFPYGNPGFGVHASAAQPYLQPFTTQSSGVFGIGGASQLQQILQLLQVVPQQLQHVQFLQQQQLLHLQQLLQLVPTQLQQLQQLIQIVPQQIQQLQQPYGSAISGPLGFGLVPQAFGGQTSHVM